MDSHPRPVANPFYAAWLPAIGLWGGVAAINMVLSLIIPGAWIVTVKIVVTSTCGVLLSLVVTMIARRLFTVRRVAGMPLLAVIVALSGTSLWMVDVVVQGWSRHHNLTWAGLSHDIINLRFNWVYFTALFGLQATLNGLLASAETLHVRDRQLVEARLIALRLQLNPHFLFNTLNALATLVAEAGATEAEEMIARLCDFLRISLSGSPGDLVTLPAELDMVQAYLDIEAVRFGARLVIQYDCAPGLTALKVPNLILQPLVENAMKYAVGRSRRPVTITILARSVERFLVLAVADDFEAGPETGLDEGWTGMGVGLKNVAERLAAIYGSDGRLEVLSGPHGFTASIHIPLRNAMPSDVT